MAATVHEVIEMQTLSSDPAPGEVQVIQDDGGGDDDEDEADDDDDEENDDDDGGNNEEGDAKDGRAGGGVVTLARPPQLKPQTSRYEGKLREEDQTAQSAFDKWQTLRKTSGYVFKVTSQKSSNEAYDFFTRTSWPDDPAGSTDQQQQQLEGQESESGDPEADEGDENGGPADESKKKLLSKSVIGNRFDWEVTDVVPARMASDTKKTACMNCQLESVYVVPSSNSVPMEQKLPEGQEPRFPEDEGLYIGQRPNAPSSRSLHRLENRILMEPNGKNLWFGQDGRLVCLSNPIQRYASRPLHLEDSEQDVPASFYCPAFSHSHNDQLSLYKPTFGLVHCQLNVDLVCIAFQFHHLFSLEHYLSGLITQAFTEYHKVCLLQRAKNLDQRLSVLYEAIDKLRETRLQSGPEEKLFQQKRLESYSVEIEAIRAESDTDCQTERSLVKKILSMRKELKEVRKRQGFTNTPINIVIRKESVNLSEDKAKWDEEVRRRVEETRWKHETAEEVSLETYQKALKAWRDMHKQRKEARRRQKQRKKFSEKGAGSADLNEMSFDEQLLANPEEEKPQRPAAFDAEQIRKDIEAHLMSCRRPPGEAKMYLEMVVDNGKRDQDLADEIVQDNRENSRRQAVTKTKILTKVHFNGQEVCQSHSRPLNNQFIINFGQIFPIQIVHYPESLTVTIIEGSNLRSQVLAEVKLPLVDNSVTIDKASIRHQDFVCTHRFKHDHSALGSSVNFSVNTDGSAIKNELIRGKLYFRVGWGTGPEGEILAPPADHWKPDQGHALSSKLDPLREVMSVDGRVDPVKLEDWIAKARIDPNDPDNEELMTRVSEARRAAENNSATWLGSPGKTEAAGNHFRLDQHQDQLIFFTDRDIADNVRFQMLLLRRNKVPEFRNFRMIPSNEKEIPRGLLEAREKRAAANRREVVGSVDPLRGRSRLYQEQLRGQVSHRFSLARHKRRHVDVVIEDPIPDLSTLAMLFGEIVPAPRPLRPIRNERKKVAVHDMSGKEIKLLLCIVRAYDVPVRSDPDPMVPSDQPKEAIVRSYVEARFQGSSARTTVAEGPNPAWNQQLSLVFRSENNDLSPDTLSRVRDCLYLHLFDEVTVDLNTDPEDGMVVHQRLEKRWLGSFAIPFSSVYRNVKIEGTFRLHSPPVLLGYDRSGLEGSSRNATFLNLYLTIQPALLVPDAVEEKLDCDESPDLVWHCDHWSRSLQLKFPSRKVHPMVADVSGKAVLMTRFLGSLKPPTELVENTDFTTATENVAWFVSLIPYTPSASLFPGIQDIWLTCDQFLGMLTGSEYEHGILLANFFTGLGKKSFLVLGSAIPEGRTAYVMTVEESGDNLLWNPVSGEQMPTNETFCPLESVWAIMNEGNIWANIQSSDRPSMIRWDLSAIQDWMPLFGRKFSHPGSPSVQPAQLIFTPPDYRAAKQLRERLERLLRDSLMNLRKKMSLRTTMNFQGNAVLRKLLPGLESSRGGIYEKPQSNNSNVSSGHLSELQRIMKSYKVCGFPWHSAFHDVDSLVDALICTGIHLSREPGVEFALAVHVEPFANTVMSIWVYLASMVRRR